MPALSGYEIITHTISALPGEVAHSSRVEEITPPAGKVILTVFFSEEESTGYALRRSRPASGAQGRRGLRWVVRLVNGRELHQNPEQATAVFYVSVCSADDLPNR